MNKIEDLKASDIDTIVSIRATMTWEDKQGNNGDFVTVTLDDSTGKCYANLFSGNKWIPFIHEIEQETVVDITGVVRDINSKSGSFNSLKDVSNIEIMKRSKTGELDLTSLNKALNEQFKTIGEGSENGVILRKLIIECLRLAPAVSEAPFSKKYFSYAGGLSAYILCMLELFDGLDNSKNGVIKELVFGDKLYDKDVIKAAIVVNRLGKGLAYKINEKDQVVNTDEGLLQDDTVLSLRIFHKAADKIGNLRYSDYLAIEHVIASSKGFVANGAAIEPKTIETHIIYHLEKTLLLLDQWSVFTSEAGGSEGMMRSAFGKYWLLQNK